MGRIFLLEPKEGAIQFIRKQIDFSSNWNVCTPNCFDKPKSNWTFYDAKRCFDKTY